MLLLITYFMKYGSTVRLVGCTLPYGNLDGVTCRCDVAKALKQKLLSLEDAQFFRIDLVIQFS